MEGLETSSQNIDFETELSALVQDKAEDELSFYEIEARILALWTELRELELEMTVLEAEDYAKNSVLTINESDFPEEVAKLEQACVEAGAEYMIRQHTLESVISTAPIINAIHAGPQASRIEQQLLPLIQRRDTLEVVATNLTKSVQRARLDINKLALERTILVDGGKGSLDVETLDVETGDAEGMQQEPEGDMRMNGTNEASDSISKEEKDALFARERYYMMKGVLSALITASGVDWSAEDSLLPLVLA